ncbi:MULTISPECIES: aspartate aminotransferase family protein [Ensifer]|uniref:Aspartate aminotransferase family protein n=1 Tax=Ensifer adhaerens TaxID=106592 RepID=A0A9Q8YFA6_ENSAD|nr:MULTISPECIES: aspartate aminotransferase family protein [Ensifer]MBD9560788.1 aspartate aminotransferase family protein [Ensifer sp. ENS03]USJ27857.1 aspartate aminotransferase family protein [Ensifer adhaerens]
MNDRPNSLHALDRQSLIHPYTNLAVHQEVGPHVITGGEGIYVVDDQGKRYIEGLAGLFCAGLGFSEPRLVEAATRQLKTMPFYHSFAHKSTEPGIRLAEKLLEMAPVPMSKVFLAGSGSEANDTAIKLVWYYNNAVGRPEKKKIISRRKAYHGVTVATASLTGLPFNHRDFDLPIANILHTDCPHYWRFAEPGESEEDFATRLVGNLEQMILEEGPETVAAFFAEPVMVSGGVITPPKTYFEKLQTVLKKYDILLVADEVICGFGRTGNMFGSETYGMKPDMISCAKQLSAAYMPISALMINEKIANVLVDQSRKIGTFSHGYTYGGHPVAAAVALEALTIYQETDIVSHVRAVSVRFQEGIAKLGDHPLIGEARGVGLVAGLEFVKDKVTKENFPPAWQVANHAGKFATERGVLTRGLGDMVSLCPAMIINEKQIDDLMARMQLALDDTLSWARSRGYVA